MITWKPIKGGADRLNLDWDGERHALKEKRVIVDFDGMPCRGRWNHLSRQTRRRLLAGMGVILIGHDTEWLTTDDIQAWAWRLNIVEQISENERKKDSYATPPDMCLGMLEMALGVKPFTFSQEVEWPPDVRFLGGDLQSELPQVAASNQGALWVEVEE